MLHTRNQPSSKVEIALCKARAKENETQAQQDDQQLIDGTGHWDDLSSCSGGSIGASSTDSLGFEDSMEIDFFDIDVF
jgi:hypothetical protein